MKYMYFIHDLDNNPVLNLYFQEIENIPPLNNHPLKKINKTQFLGNQ